MALIITNSVGVAGTNRENDVRTVQTLLNNWYVFAQKQKKRSSAPGARIPAAKVVPVTGRFDGATEAAIREFQREHFRIDDGMVCGTFSQLLEMTVAGKTVRNPQLHPASFQKLNQYDAGNAAIIEDEGLETFRKKVVQIALAEARTGVKGAVSDLDTVQEGGRQVRRGWRRLQEYIDAAVEGWTQQQWNDKRNLEGLQVPGKRLPAGTEGLHWCGIFAVWCWMQAGIHARFRLGNGGGPNVPTSDDVDFVRPGDIVVLKGGLIHHFVVTEVNAAKRTFTSVNGNSDAQSVLVKADIPFGDPFDQDEKKGVRYYYSLASALNPKAVFRKRR